MPKPALERVQDVPKPHPRRRNAQQPPAADEIGLPPPTPVQEPPAGELKSLSLAEIGYDDIDVRSQAHKDEEERIDALARSIYEQGQLQPVVVRPNPAVLTMKPGTGKSSAGPLTAYLIIAGRRRLKAIELIEQKTGMPWKVQALVVSKTDDEAWDAAFSENYARRNFSPIELAQNILTLKARKNWDGEAWTKQASEYLGVSRATVSQHVKLLNFPEHVQAKIHSGLMTAQAAFDFLAVEEKRREEVLARAEILAAEEQSKSTMENAPPASGGSSDTSPAPAIESTPQSGPNTAPPDSDAGHKGRFVQEYARAFTKAIRSADAKEPNAKQPDAKGSAQEQKATVARRHVVKAARETESLTQNKPRSRTDIVQFFVELPAASPEPMAKFATSFSDKWVKGEITDRTLQARWWAIAELVELGLKRVAAKRAK